MMQAVDFVPIVVQEVYNISHILDDRGVFGTFLRALFGYNSSPTLIHLIAWGFYMITAITLWKRTYAYEK